MNPYAIRPCVVCLLALTLTGTAGTAGAEEAGEAADRYAVHDPAGFTASRRPVTRTDYVDFVRPLAAGFESGPDRGQYGPRHALPALAVFALEGKPELGAGIKQTLRHYADWVDECIRTQNGVFSMEGATLCAFHFRELRKHGLLTEDDERWVKRLLLALREYQCAWTPGDGLWRGSHHRSQCQGINHALAAALYPEEPAAAQWQEYARTVWADWWDFRDVGINDTGYFYSSLQNIVRAAELLERSEVFTDPQSRNLFDRILFRITPNGAAAPYGSHAGYHGAAGAEIFILETAARHTRDGRYRWGAHRLMNFGQQRGFSNNQHHVQAMALEAIALASLVCDDTVLPVEPEGSSQLLTRKEIVRLTSEQVREQFPEFGGVDCNMFMTQRVLPHKLVFRAGWDPADMYLLMEAYPRHDPLNPTAIVACERHGVPFAEMCSEKFVSRENAVRIDDLSGTAVYCGRRDFPAGAEKKLPLGYAGMESTVPVFEDHPLATHARLRVTNYMGFQAAHEREVLFVKNRFVLVRDETAFDDSFRARVGPIWNTQNVGTPRGAHWLNTWFTTHWFQTAPLYETPPWDLLVYHSPQSNRRLTVTELGEAHTGPTHLLSTQYGWEGEVQPGTRVQSVSVLLPHAPLQDASPLVQGIEMLRDEPGLAAVCIRGDDGCEVAVLNPDGAKLTLTPIAGRSIWTRAPAAYVRIVDGQVVESVALGGSPLRVGGKAKALIVDGFSNHDWQQTTAIVRRILAGTGRFEVDVSTSPPTKEAAGWDTWRPGFADYDVVIVNCNSLGGRPTWPREVEVALEQYVREGGGLYILHSANNAFAHWPEYDRMIGLGWRGKEAGYALTVAADGSIMRIELGEGSGTSHGPRVDAAIHVLGDHPIHAGYPRVWKTPDVEIYTYARGPAEELTVLSYAHDAKTGKNWPMEWVVKYGRGSVYNSTFGHVWAGDQNPVSTRCVGFRTTLIRAAEWLASGQVTWPLPDDFPTEDTLRLDTDP